ncbi:MAG: hypothetical protein ACE37F_13880 [Nannocystaceae bacterium]|nr:hypothetical protein [bacterium]
MTTPPRLCDDARDALAAYRDAAPGAARRQANLDAVLDRVEREAPVRPAAAAGLLWPIGWGVASAAAAAGLIWGVITVRSPESVAPTPARQPAAAEPATPSTRRAPAVPQAPVEAAPPGPVQTPPKRPVSPKPTSAPQGEPPRGSDLVAETRVLREVRASIGAGAYEDAARQLQAYTLEFPDGALREDAQAYRVIVACKRGRVAATLRSAFVRRYPDSPHAARIAAACEGEKE